MKIAMYSELKEYSILETVYVHKITYRCSAKLYHIKDMYHIDKGKYTEYMFKQILMTYKELIRRKLEFKRDRLPIHPYFEPLVYNDEILNPEMYI